MSGEAPDGKVTARRQDRAPGRTLMRLGDDYGMNTTPLM